MGTQIISYHCRLTDRMGKVISSTVVRDVIVDPNAKHVPLQALSVAMLGMKKGEHRRILLRAHEAYGLYDPKLVTTCHLDDVEIQTGFRLGEEIQVLKDGKKIPMRVVSLSTETVTFDGNHPLAGQDLVFAIQAIDTREATADDLEEAPTGLPFVH
jgi:FKBP-type peptidyl-prolyl cis-trans isomerase SlyD